MSLIRTSTNLVALSHVAHQVAKRDNATKLVDVLISDIGVRDVVEHQEDTSESQHQEQEEGNTTQTPGIRGPHGLSAHFDRMQMEEHVAHHDQRLVQWGVGAAMPKD